MPNRSNQTSGYFPIINAYGSCPNYTKRFTALLKRIGIHTMYTRTFHSFRHAGITLLRVKECPTDLRNFISGHSQKGADEGIRTYMHNELLREKAKWIEKLDYGLDFDGIKDNGWRPKLNDGAQGRRHR